MKSNINTFACKDHIDMAMDEIINETESFPIIENVKEEKCDYCNNMAEYIVKIAQ